MSNDIAVRVETSVLSQMTVEELRAELASTLTLTARHLIHIADVWHELQRRGEDLSHLRSGLWTYMPLLASGELRPELVIRYAGNAMLLRQLARLPRYEQDIILSNDVVTLVEPNGSTLTERKVAVQQLNRTEISRVFKGRIVLRDEQTKNLSKSKSRGIGHGAILREKAYEAAKSRGRVTDERVTRTVSLRVSETEWSALQSQAVKADASVPTLILGALSALGLFKGPR